MSAECRRWANIGDREAIGEAVTEDDERFRSEHPTTCDTCAREADMWRALEGASREPLPEAHASAEAMDRILKEAARDQPHSATPQRPTGRMGGRVSRLGAGIAVVSALAVAASVLLVVRGRGSDLPSPSAQTAPATVARAVVASVVGDVLVDGSPVVVGAPVLAGANLRAEGKVCLDIEPAVHACVGAAAEARFADASLAHRVIELRRGHLDAVLGHQPTGTSFRVDTPKGTVTAVGTAFSVDVAGGAGSSGSVVVRVREGVVVVRAPGAPELQVAAGEEAVVGAPRASLVAPAASPDLPAAPPAATLSAPGSAGLGVSPKETVPAPSVAASTTVDMTPPGQGRPLGGAAPLLAQARTLRAAGEFREAADAYRQLESTYPGSAEAHASLVSLGDLLVSQLGDPAGGLRAFDAYLASGGVLSQEAEFGRIGALRSLGQRAEEREAIVSFLSRYPATLHDDALRARLGALGRPR